MTPLSPKGLFKFRTSLFSNAYIEGEALFSENRQNEKFVSEARRSTRQQESWIFAVIL